MSLSTTQIAAQLDRVLASDASARALAIRAETRAPWPETLSQRGRQFALRWCDSTLAIRAALCDLDAQGEEAPGVIIVTPLGGHQLADDILARLAKGRVFQPEGWELVRQLFQARETDARLGRYAWMPQSLIDAAARGPYAPVPNGFLGLEAAWQAVLERFLGIPTARPDLLALLEWSQRPGADEGLAALPSAARAAVLEWLAETAGTAGALVVGCVQARRTADALPLGLACGVVFAPEGEGQVVLGQAAVRLERFVENRHIGVAEGRAWAQAAEQLAQAAGAEASRAALERADALLAEVGAAAFAQLSHWLPRGLDQRLRVFAETLTAQVSSPGAAELAQVEEQADRALRHRLLAAQPPRAERLDMARRLARWLLAPPPAADSFPSAAAWQAEQGAFVDWARFRLLGGDELAELSRAYAACRAAVGARREPFARAFAEALVAWNANQPSLEGWLLPVEAVLERLLAPLAAAHPVLLLVMDGLSLSIFRELFMSSASHGWTEWVPEGSGRAHLGVAALPTVTEVSRASLLSGQLTLGAAAQEKKGFAAHPALLAHSAATAPPRLFHKGELSESGHLAQSVRAAVTDLRQRVLGVVYNAVDDHLSGPDQLHQRWRLEDLRLLLPLLSEAREARRVVLLSADHGHLLEEHTQQLPGAEPDRWRPGHDSREPHELTLRGGRVLTREASRSVVCLWGEGTRYNGRKNGYHGGVSPQEVLVPLAVLAPLGLDLPGWTPAPPPQPEWWEAAPSPTLPPPQAAADAPPASRKPRPAKAPSVPAGQSQLFAPEELPAHGPPTGSPVASPSAPPGGLDWMDALLGSPVYASQQQLAARVALKETSMRALLGALHERGGKLSRTALAQRLAQPEVRLTGTLSAARRVLNVDQSPVLVVDEAAGMVELNLPLLRQQFRLGGEGGS